MRRLRRRPPGVRPIARCIALGATRNRDARKLHPRRSRAKDPVVGIFSGKASLTHRADETDATKNLHRASSYVVAFHAGRLTASARFGDRHLDAALREIDR